MKFSELQVGNKFVIAKGVRKVAKGDGMLCCYFGVVTVYVKTRLNVSEDKLQTSNAVRLSDGVKDAFRDDLDVSIVLM